MIDDFNIDKFNPYKIEKDFECKTCFAQFYEKEIQTYEMNQVTLTHRIKIFNEIVDCINISFHPICPNCKERNMKIIILSYKEGSWEGGDLKFGMLFRSLGFYNCSYININ